MVEERAASFTKRSLKTSAKLAGLKLAVSMCDLTTLEGKDTPGKVAYLCRKALQPIEAKYNVPSCAAVCVSALNEKCDAQAEGEENLQPREPPLRGVVPDQELENAEGG